MRLLRILFLPVSVLLITAATLAVPLPVFLERPGNPVSLVEHVAVDAPDSDGIDGDFLLTLVNLRRATTAGMFLGLLDAETEFVPAGHLTGGLDDDTYFESQRALFADTADVAAAVALEAAGFPVERSAAPGALVAHVVPGAPSDGVLRPGDVITSVDGEPVRGASDLIRAVRRAASSQLELGVLRDDAERQVRLTPGRVPDVEEPALGVQVHDVPPAVELPVPVDVDAGAIGGPSAGLMVALTVFDAVSEEDLAAGRRVAGTGAISARGHVEPVGGIALKVLAADRAGVDLFLSPAEQLPEALSAVAAGSSLEVVGVSTFSDALQALRDDDGRTARSPAHGSQILAVVPAGPRRREGLGRLAVPAAGSTGRVRGAVPRDVAP